MGCVCLVGVEVISKVPDEICEDRMALMRRKVMGLEAALQEAVGALTNCGEGRGERMCRDASTFCIDCHLAGKVIFRSQKKGHDLEGVDIVEQECCYPITYLWMMNSMSY